MDFSVSGPDIFWLVRALHCWVAPDPCRLIVSLDTVWKPGSVFRPEGAAVNSPGRQPREGDRAPRAVLLSPEGTVVAPGATVAPSGLKKTARLAFPGLTPRAIDARPFRAEEGQRTSETILPGGRVVRNPTVKRSIVADRYSSRCATAWPPKGRADHIGAGVAQPVQDAARRRAQGKRCD